MKSALALVLTTACVAPPADGVVDQGLRGLNGRSLNGTSLNGTSLNGRSLNGTSLNGTSLNGRSLNGTSLNGTSLNGAGVDVTAVVGSAWDGTASNGETVPLRIDAARVADDGETGFYLVSYETLDHWSPLCVDALGAPVEAIAVPGTWDATASYAPSDGLFTFACRFKSVAKCVELGYAPWDGYADHMAACVRMLRADYCGTGVSYTADGTLINLFDNAGVQLDTEGWSAEAEWTPRGARCVNVGKSRFAHVASSDAPPCLGALASVKSCGSFDSGALLIDELPPQSYLSTLAKAAR